MTKAVERAFETLGVIDRYFAKGAANEDVDFFAPDARS